MPVTGYTRGGEGVTCICRDTGMCHYFGYFFFGGVAPGLLGTFLGYSRIFGYSWIFRCHFLVKLDFFQNNPDFGVLILIFLSMTLWNVACRALVSMIYYACEKSSILFITAISLRSYVCSAF